MASASDIMFDHIYIEAGMDLDQAPCVRFLRLFSITLIINLCYMY